MKEHLAAPDGVSLYYCGDDHPGHPGEYIMRYKTRNTDIGRTISNELERLLPGFDVSNRGDRVELFEHRPDGDRYTASTAATVTKAVEQAIEKYLELGFSIPN